MAEDGEASSGAHAHQRRGVGLRAVGLRRRSAEEVLVQAGEAERLGAVKVEPPSGAVEDLHGGMRGGGQGRKGSGGCRGRSALTDRLGAG